MSERKRKPRMRRSRGVFVSLCLIAALVLAVGTGIFSQRTLEEQALSGNTATNLSESVAEVNLVEEEKPEPYEIASDAEYGDYEKGKVLIAVDETTDLQHLDEVLAANDLVQTKSVSDQDTSGGFVRVNVDGDVPIKQILGALANEGLKAQPNYIYYPAEDVASTDTSADALTDTSASTSDSASIETSANTLTSTSNAALASVANDMSTSSVSVNDPSATQQWMLESLDAYRAWGIAKGKEDAATSPKVSVAVIDTGCLVAHEDLVGNIRGVYNSASLEVGLDKVSDSIGHGTHVAGIVAADANNGKGVAGVSYDAGLVIIKASQGETKNFSTETLSQAYTWLMTSIGTQSPAQMHNVRVVNMSVGGKGSIDTDDVLYQNISKAKNAGILTVCAAGNADASATPPYDCIPGDYEDCFTVMNLAKVSGEQPNDSSGTSYVTLSGTSNYNVASGTLSNAKNISAPGANIYSTTFSGTSSYGSMSGTSMASPAVAGVAALLFAYDPGLSPDEVRNFLEQTATDIGAEGWDSKTGFGEVDAYHALQVLSAEIANDQVMGEQPVALEVHGADSVAADASEWQWESSDPSILAVDNTAGTATAIGAGTATLTATHKKLASRTLSKQVEVNNAGLEEKIDLSDTSAISASIDPSQTFAYTGQEARPSVTVKTKDGKTLKEGTDYTLEYANNISASVNTTNKKACVIVTAAETSGIYTGSVELYFTIDQADVSAATIDPIADQKYTGNAITPKPVVKLGNNTLSVIDYTVSYKNNTNAGTATLVVTGKGNYKGTKEATFKITQDQGSTSTSSTTESQPRPVTVPATYTYNPTTHPQTLSATVTYDSNFIKGEKARFTYNISGNTKPLLYKLNSFEIQMSDGSWSPLVDITRGEYGNFSEKNYFEDALYTPGNYRLSFLVVEYTANADGTKKLGDMQRFQINFTVSETDNFKSIETVVKEVVAQCEQECAGSKGTSSYDYDRALWLNDWLVANTKYDNSLTYCSAEGVFNRGLGTCEGYHEAYTMLLNKAGIETRRVEDTGDAHVWTGVKLNGNWYNIDTTWNDSGGYVRNDLDVEHLYFALPSGITQQVHPKWDGQYLVQYPKRATFDANAYADNYFIHSGKISQYVNSYTAESGTYSVKSMLNSSSVKSQLASNGTASFDVPVEKSSWPDNYKNVIYNLVAYQLGTQDWGSGIRVSIGYSDNALHFNVTSNGSTPRIAITNAVVMNLEDQTYSGNAVTPKPTVMVDGKTLVEGTDYQLTYANNVNASVVDKTKPATLTIQGIGAYCGSLKKTFTIKQASMSSAAIAAISTQTYTGSALTPKVTVTLAGKMLTTSDYTVSYKNNTNAGTATVTITGKGNCTGTKEATFKINPKTLPNSLTLSAISYTYDGKAKTPGVTIKDGSKTLVNNTDYTVKYSNNVNVGTAATVTVTGKGNYTGTRSATFRINAKTLPNSITLSATSYTYDGKAKTPGVTVKDGSKTLVNGTDYMVKYSNNVNVGTATVTVTGKGVYTGTRSTTFTIKAKSSSGSGSSSTPSASKTIEPGTYIIKTRLDNGKALDISGGSTKNGGNVQIYQNNLTAAQRFRINYDAKTGYYTITNLNSYKVLDVSGGKANNGRNVQQYQSNGTMAQKWIISGNSNTGYTITSALNKKFVLDVSGASKKNGANIQIYSSNNSTAQKFNFERTDAGNNFAGGSFVIASNLDSNKVVDIAGGRKTNGTNVQLYSFNNSAAQRFSIKYDANTGYYVITNISSGKVLDVSGAKMVNGRNVQQYQSNNSLAQRWKIIKNKDNTYTIASALDSSYVLDVKGGSKNNGANIQIYKTNGSKAQKFTFKKV